MSANIEKTDTAREPGRILTFKPPSTGKRRARVARARYYYPREALDQAYFTRNGYGEKVCFGLYLGMLASGRFESQIELLLSQLTNEGFDVTGPKVEFDAMREILRRMSGELEHLISGARKLQNHCSDSATI